MTIKEAFEAFAVLLEERSKEYDRYVAESRSSYPGEIGRLASVNDSRKANDYREIASLARKVAKQV